MSKRIIYGIGYIENNPCIPTSENGKKTRCYYIWVNILKRCFGLYNNKKDKSYIECVICEEWLCYNNFAVWYHNNFIDGYEIDKDIIGENSNIYSPKTCCFVPQSLNSFMANKKSDNKSGYIGVHFENSSKKWKAQINIDGKRKNLGRFKTPEDASKAYQKARKIEAEKWKTKAKELGLDQEIIDNIK